LTFYRKGIREKGKTTTGRRETRGRDWVFELKKRERKNTERHVKRIGPATKSPLGGRGAPK